MSWKRYRFKTWSADDPRPLVFNPAYPFWISGYGNDGNNNEYAIVIAYLPPEEELTDYWDDAFDIEYTDEEKINFSSRFPKPHYYKEEQ